MRKVLSASAALLALAGTALTAAPAEARWHGGGYGYHGGYYRHGGGAGLAVGAGILGLAAGAAIASRPYYGRPYYAAAPAYGYGYGYYAPPPPPPAYGYYRPCGRWAYWHGYC